MASGGVKGKSGSRNASGSNAKENLGWYGNSEVANHDDMNIDRDDYERLFGITRAEVSSVSYFTGNDYDSIREAQQNNETEGYYFEKGRDMENFIVKAPKYYNQGPIYRGIDVSNEVADKILNTLSNGGSIDMLGTSSWSSNIHTARDNFAYAQWNKTSSTNKSIVFVLPKGTKAGASIKNISEHKDEDEVLVSRKTRFTASKIEVDPTLGHFVIYVNERLAK